MSQKGVMDTFSFSRLNLYETCPHRFYRRYVEGYPEPETYPLALGSGVHKAIESKMNGASHEQAVLNGLIEANFHKEVTKKELSNLTWNAPIQGDNAIRGQTEVYFKLPLSDEADAPKIQGYIDVVGNGYILDWKTNRAPYDVRKNQQIALYAWAMSRVRGFQQVHGSLYFLRFRRESGYHFTLQEMEGARSWAYSLSKAIQGKLQTLEVMPELKDELFPAQPSSFCSHCPFSVECVRKFKGA